MPLNVCVVFIHSDSPEGALLQHPVLNVYRFRIRCDFTEQVGLANLEISSEK